MSSTFAVSTKLNLSSETINSVILEVVDTAHALGLPLNEARANPSGRYADIRRLVDLHSNFESVPIPNPDQCWQ